MLDTASVIDLLAQPRKIVITTHHKPDGDAMGSSLGLYNYLIQQGHHTTVITPTDYPHFFNWMPGNGDVLRDHLAEQHVQHHDDRDRDEERHRVKHGIRDTQQVERWLQQMSYRRFADAAQQNGAHGDAELCRRDSRPGSRASPAAFRHRAACRAGRWYGSGNGAA